MNWLKPILSLSGWIADLGKKANKVIFTERKARARRDLEELRRRKRNLMSTPPTKKKARKLWATEKRIKELQSYLNNM